MMSNYTTRYQDEDPDFVQCLHLDSTADLVTSVEFTSEVVVSLSANTLDVMKHNTGFANGLNMTYVALGNSADTISTDTFVLDMYSNPVVPIEVNTAQWGLIVPDTTNPAVASFDLDTFSNLLTLTFSETVDAATFDITSLSLVDADPTATETFQFTSDSTIALRSGSLTVAIVSIGSTDAANLAALSLVAKSPTQTFLLTTDALVLDMMGLPLTAVEASGTLQVNDFTRSGISRYECIYSGTLVVFLGRCPELRRDQRCPPRRCGHTGADVCTCQTDREI